MYTQHGAGYLPVYAGTRFQRGGGILSSLARFFIPTAKKMLTETVRAAPSVIDSIVNKNQSPGKALLGGLKNAGLNTATHTLKRLAPPHRPVNNKKLRRKQSRAKQHRDVFS